MRRNTTVRRLAIAGLVLILYLILSLLYFGTTGDYSRMYLGIGSDPTAYIWFLNWWPWAIAHGQNPFISHYVWYPEGFNMTWAGSMPTGALFIFPVTWLANAVVSFNVLSLLAPVLSAWMAFLLARYVTRDTAASIIGGYLFGFSSYEVAKMLGHLNLNLTFVVPLLVLLFVMRARGDLSRPRFVAAVAIALLVQLGLSTEILATACFFGGITWAIFLVFAAAEERGRLWMIAGEIILAAGIMAVLGAPFLFFVLKDLADVPLQINSPAFYSADLLNYLIPTEVTRLGSMLFTGMTHGFTGNMAEQLAYLGLPVILILILQFRDLSRRPCLKPLLVTLLVIAILSLAPSLHVGGVANRLWLPWRLA